MKSSRQNFSVFSSTNINIDENLPELIFSAMDKYGSISIY